MSGLQECGDLFGWRFPPPLSGGSIDTLCKEDTEASCLYIEFQELCKQGPLTAKQQERKKQITTILQYKIAAMKKRKEEERSKIEKIANEELAGIQLCLFPIWVYFF